MSNTQADRLSRQIHSSLVSGCRVQEAHAAVDSLAAIAKQQASTEAQAAGAGLAEQVLSWAAGVHPDNLRKLGATEFVEAALAQGTTPAAQENQ